MNNQRVSSWWAAWLLSHPWTVAGLLALIAAVSIGTLPFLQIEAGMEPFFDRSRPEQKVLDGIRDTFIGDNLLFVAYATDDVFSAESLSTIRTLSDELLAFTITRADGSRVPAIAEVTSLATVKDVVGQDMRFEARPLLPTPVPVDAAALAHIRARALQNPLIRDGLLGSDPTKVAALVARLENGLSDAELVQVVAAARDASARFESAHTHFHVTGDPVFNVDTAAYMRSDLQLFIPIIYVALIAMLFVVLRRVAGVALALANITLAMLIGMAALRWVGGTVNNLSTMMPPVMMVLSVANTIHFLSELATNTHKLGAKAAPAHTLTELWGPSLMCQVTTAAGFASLAISEVPALKHFGLAAAIACLVAVFVEFMVAALVARWGTADRFIRAGDDARPSRIDTLLMRYAMVVMRRPWPYLVASLILFAVGVAGIPRIVADENTVTHFTEGTPVRRQTAFADDNLGGTTLILVSIHGSAPGHFHQPEALHKLEALTAFMQRELGVERVTSVADYVKLMHWGFGDEQPGARRIPDTAEQVAQLMLLNSDDTIRYYVNGDAQWVRVEARLPEHSTAKLEGVFAKLEQYLTRELPAEQGYRVDISGQPYLWVLTNNDIVRSQTDSFGLSFLLIFGPMFLLFRSWSAWLFTIPSNLFPIGVVLGIMGWTGIRLNTATAMVASIVLGIAVDDTIHFIACLRTQIHEHGDTQRALIETFRIKGSGVSWTAAIITFGFAVLMLSKFNPTREFGFLTGCAILTGVLGELLMLPSLIVVTGSRLGVRRRPTAVRDTRDTDPLSRDLPAA